MEQLTPAGIVGSSPYLPLERDIITTITPTKAITEMGRAGIILIRQNG